MEHTTNDMYQRCGFHNREHYLKYLAMKYDLDIATIQAMAHRLGKDQDFLELITELEASRKSNIN